ncbi:hypothetical protein EJ03DRAFT_353836 [Teratosphaeria nubilosa]|uniref:Uncharacterized protein n=1 Tax=Teratosphaeria nubilosa TaxID=161662 RepID=A0A6G1L0Y0_9PEZI|nr:hypothetical protein EJ03DRAFT_353836 [Teratosphaeria nubilosa]
MELAGSLSYQCRRVDVNGFDRNGISMTGMSREMYDEETYNPFGYDVWGHSRAGLDVDLYDPLLVSLI